MANISVSVVTVQHADEGEQFFGYTKEVRKDGLREYLFSRDRKDFSPMTFQSVRQLPKGGGHLYKLCIGGARPEIISMKWNGRLHLKTGKAWCVVLLAGALLPMIHRGTQ